MPIELVGTNEIQCKELQGRKERDLQWPVEGHLQPSPSTASVLMGKGLETDITETTNKPAASNFKSIHGRIMPAFKNLHVKVLNKGQDKIILAWFNTKSCHPAPTSRHPSLPTGNCEGGVHEEIERLLMCSPLLTCMWVCMWIFPGIIWPYWRDMWFNLTWWQSHWDTCSPSLEGNPKFGFCSPESF